MKLLFLILIVLNNVCYGILKEPNDTIKYFYINVNDTCELCSGQHRYIFFSGNENRKSEYLLNNTVINSLRLILDTVVDFNKDPKSHSLKENTETVNFCLNTYANSIVNYNSSKILSLKFEVELTCGTGVSDRKKIKYVNFNFKERKVIKLNDIIIKNKFEKFEKHIMNYASKNKIDNVEICCDDFYHSKDSLIYFPVLDQDFSIDHENFILYIKIYDKNQLDWYRRGNSSDIIGYEYMRLTIPIRDVIFFIKKKYRHSFKIKI